MMLQFCVFLSTLVPALGDDTITIKVPQSLRDQFQPNGLVPSSPALFGIPAVGRTLVGNVYQITKIDTDACQPFTKEELQDANIPSTSTVFFMVDRGNCNFVTKVRHVQHAGGSAAIIVDNVDEIYVPFMADDGTGGDISIPSVLISFGDGEQLKQHIALNGQGSITISMAWKLPNPDGVVEWNMWTTPVDPAATSFKKNFRPVIDSLGDSQQFEPHFVILDGTELGCVPDACGNQCTNGGRYCQVDPDDNILEGVSGRDLVVESLRQLCLYEQLNATKKTNLWWTYAARFEAECNKEGEDSDFSNTCSFRIMASLGVATGPVDECMQQSGGLGGEDFDQDIQNTKLENCITGARNQGVAWWPILYINNSPYYESLQCPVPQDVTTCGPLNMICGGYAEGTAPCACVSSPGCGLCQFPDNCGVCLSLDDPSWGQSCKKGLSAGAIVIIILVCVLLLGMVIIWYQRAQQQKMRDDIDGLLAQYQPLDDAMVAQGSVVQHGKITKPKAPQSEAQQGLMQDMDASDDA